MLGAATCLLCAGACSGFSSPPAAADSGAQPPGDGGVALTDGSAPSAEGGGGAACVAGTAFGAGLVVPIDGAYSVEAARFTPDRTTAYLSLCPASGDKTQCDLYTSQFSPTLAKFTAFTKMNGVSTPNKYDAYPTMTPDGSTMVFGSSRGSSVGVYVARAQNGSFEAPIISRLDVAGTDFGNEPYVLRDGQTLFVSAGKNANSRSDLYRIKGAPPWTAAAAEPVPGVNLPADNELAPVVSDDEREIFFASNRLTPNVDFALDIFTATRALPTDTFSTPERVASLSSAGIDWPLWLSPDGCELYYINKINNVATMYVARRVARP